jgi:Uma2 family endonuclease
MFSKTPDALMAETQAPEPTHKAPPAAPVSYDEFLEWADEDVHAEWINGEVRTMPPASAPHQRIVHFLSGILSTWVEEREAGEVFVAPFQMKLEERPSGREPDVLVVTEAHRDRIHETHVEGPADLVVEVVSPGSGPRDRGDKFYEYEAAGIPEYWIADPEREQLEVYRLTEDRYESAFMGAKGRVESEVLDGLWVRAEWLWQRPLPKLLDVLSELGLL